MKKGIHTKAEIKQKCVIRSKEHEKENFKFISVSGIGAWYDAVEYVAGAGSRYGD